MLKGGAEMSGEKSNAALEGQAQKRRNYKAQAREKLLGNSNVLTEMKIYVRKGYWVKRTYTAKRID